MMTRRMGPVAPGRPAVDDGRDGVRTAARCGGAGRRPAGDAGESAHLLGFVADDAGQVVAHMVADDADRVAGADFVARVAENEYAALGVAHDAASGLARAAAHHHRPVAGGLSVRAGPGRAGAGGLRRRGGRRGRHGRDPLRQHQPPHLSLIWAISPPMPRPPVMLEPSQESSTRCRNIACHRPAGRARAKPALLGCLLPLLGAGNAGAQTEPSDGPRHSYGTANGEWRSYAGDVAGAKYSPLDRVDAGNFDRLKVAWEWTSVDAVLSRSTPGGSEWRACPEAPSPVSGCDRGGTRVARKQRASPQAVGHAHGRAETPDGRGVRVLTSVWTVRPAEGRARRGPP